MIKDLPKNQLQKIVDFAIDNYDDAPEHLYPKTVEELLERDGNSEVIVLEDDYGIEGMCMLRFLTPKLVESYRTIVRMDVRRRGVSKKLAEISENMLRNAGVKKIKCNVYTTNLPSLFRRLKGGFLVEGTLKNHERRGSHEYVLGKEL